MSVFAKGYVAVGCIVQCPFKHCPSLICLTHVFVQTLYRQMKERDEIRYRFGFESGIIYPFIGDCITKYNSSIDILAKAFKCLASWLRFGGGLL